MKSISEGRSWIRIPRSWPGWQNIMPTFRGQITEEEVFQLIAYFRSLARGETPDRVESYPPPQSTPPINSSEKAEAP